MNIPVMPSTAGVLVKQVDPLQVPLTTRSMNTPLPATLCRDVVPLANDQLSDVKLKLLGSKVIVFPVKSTVADVKKVPVWPNWFVGVVPATMDMAKDPVLAPTTSGGASGP